jgi:hypothetical protein
LNRFLGAPWWQGVSALLAGAGIFIGAFITWQLFQIQQTQSRLEREQMNSLIQAQSGVSGAFEVPSDPTRWRFEVGVSLVNLGPNSAELVELDLLVGNAGLPPVDTYRPISVAGDILLEEGRPQVEYLEDSVAGRCNFHATVENWQVDERLDFKWELYADQATTDAVRELWRERYAIQGGEGGVLSQEDARRFQELETAVVSKFVPTVRIYRTHGLNRYRRGPTRISSSAVHLTTDLKSNERSLNS